VKNSKSNPETEMIKLLDKSIRAAELAHEAYTRYSQNPHTRTGQKALVRYEQRDLEYADAVDELRAKIREAFEA